MSIKKISSEKSKVDSQLAVINSISASNTLMISSTPPEDHRQMTITLFMILIKEVSTSPPKLLQAKLCQLAKRIADKAAHHRTDCARWSLLLQGLLWWVPLKLYQEQILKQECHLNRWITFLCNWMATIKDNKLLCLSNWYTLLSQHQQMQANTKCTTLSITLKEEAKWMDMHQEILQGSQW